MSDGAALRGPTFRAGVEAQGCDYHANQIPLGFQAAVAYVKEVCDFLNRLHFPILPVCLYYCNEEFSLYLSV